MSRFLLPWQKSDITFYTTEVLVLGSGIAGLYTAIKAAQQRYQVIVLTKKDVAEGNTEHAQGGIAAAIDESDSPSLHFEDTLKAGAGLCNEEAVRILVEEGPRRVRELIDMGACFDRIGGLLALTREGAHSRNRVLHAQGDATGWEIERTLVAQVKQRPLIEVREYRFVLDILTDQAGKAIGALALNTATAALEGYLAGAVVVATGGLGQLFRYTTNPEVATGDGMAAAYRAGAELMDMEFVQFHPTAALIPGAPRFLISEAVRGEGAVLINSRGERFMAGIPGQELAPRDIVARAIWQEMANSRSVYLDMRPLGETWIRQRFPNIYRMCLKYGIDAAETPVPVAPAVHYMMGGIRTNSYGETSVKNLFAAGECACNGVHGANRLASNSLLDGLVFGGRIVDRLTAEPLTVPSLKDVPDGGEGPGLTPAEMPPAGYDPGQLREKLQDLMWEKVGILRTGEGLAEAEKQLMAMDRQVHPRPRPGELELKNMLTLGVTMARAALSRKESRGGHYRVDYPLPDDAHLRMHSVQRKGDHRVRFVAD